MSDIVFVGAVGRSGTTLLERTLATGHGIVALGEMVHMSGSRSSGWTSRAVADWRSATARSGAPLARRPSADGTRSISRLSARDRRAVDRNRYIPLLIARRPRPAASSERRTSDSSPCSTRCTRRFTRSPRERRPMWCWSTPRSTRRICSCCATMPRHHLHLLHVVRDPRGVVHSWSRTCPVPNPASPWNNWAPLAGCARWISHNLLFQLAGWIGVERRRLSYERFTRDPAEIGRSVDALLDRSSANRALGRRGDGPSRRRPHRVRQSDAVPGRRRRPCDPTTHGGRPCRVGDR